MNSAKTGIDPRTLILGILKGAAAGVVSAAILMLIMTAIACATPDPGKITAPLGYAALAVSSLIGGIFAVRFTGDGILSGLLCGCVMSLIFWALVLIPVGWERSLSEGISALMHLIPCGMGALGALVGRKPTAKRRKKRRQHRP